jgi:hypothetical protein
MNGSESSVPLESSVRRISSSLRTSTNSPTRRSRTGFMVAATADASTVPIVLRGQSPSKSRAAGAAQSSALLILLLTRHLVLTGWIVAVWTSMSARPSRFQQLRGERSKRATMQAPAYRGTARSGRLRPVRPVRGLGRGRPNPRSLRYSGALEGSTRRKSSCEDSFEEGATRQQLSRSLCLRTYVPSSKEGESTLRMS